MDPCASLTTARRLASAVLLFLALYCPFQALAQNTFSRGTVEEEIASPQKAGEKSDLTLLDAVQLTLRRNPELAAFAREIRALGGVTLQAGLFRNPDLSVETEDMGSPVRPEPVVQQFATLRVSQLIELGGKRAAR